MPAAEVGSSWGQTVHPKVGGGVPGPLPQPGAVPAWPGAPPGPAVCSGGQRKPALGAEADDGEGARVSAGGRPPAGACGRAHPQMVPGHGPGEQHAWEDPCSGGKTKNQSDPTH